MIRTTLTVMLLAGVVSGTLAAQYDIIVRGGRVLDGSGNPWRRVDVAVAAGRIAAVGNLTGASAERVIDAAGLYVAPGFIDAHSHAGPALATPELSHARPLLAQGITTVVVNPDGGGPTDLIAQRAALERDGLGVNVALLVPHGSLRGAVIGMQDRAPSADELGRMEEMTREGMEAGAFGLSTGLYYAPGSYSDTEEVIALARVASAYGGIYTSHVRDEADYNVGVIAALDEVIRIAREADLPAVHTHVKALGPRVWGFSSAIVHRIDRAREEGLEIYADQYPYEASATGVSASLIPRWAQVGGNDSLLARLSSPNTWPRIRAEIVENFDRRGGADRLQVRRYVPNPALEGRTLADIARERGVAPPDLVRSLLMDGDGGVVSFNMHEDDVRTLMQPAWTMTASDGDLVPMGEGVPHPRSYGTFPRKIRHYAYEQNVVPLSQAIRSMTGLPAAVLRMDDRGMLIVGRQADLVVFDMERLRDVATYQHPHQLAEGMVYVMVNGRLAIDGGEFTGVWAGDVLRR
jgi:N-acyl-D-aspartate/D-glutamate deacylase